MSLLFTNQWRCSTLFIKYFARSRPTHGHRIIGRFGAWVQGRHSNSWFKFKQVCMKIVRFSLMSSSIVPFLFNLVPTCLTESFQGKLSPLRVIGMRSSFAFLQLNAMHMVLLFFGSFGSVEKTRSDSLAWSSQMLTIFCKSCSDVIRRITSSAQRRAPYQWRPNWRPWPLFLRSPTRSSRYVEKPPFGENTAPCLVPFVTLKE